MNPFEPYLPCYPAGTVPERPWWRADRPTVLRLGGYIYRRTDGAEAAAYEGEDPFAELAAYDDAHPLPVPPPMEGQVWRRPGFSDHGMIAHLSYSIAGAVRVTWGSGERDYVPRGDGICSLTTMEWPPRDAVLVLGPTPWGRDCPWAPVGWRP